MSKYKVGDKFIIEIEKIYESSLKGIDVFEDMEEPLYKIKGFNSLVFDKNGLDRLEEVADKKNGITTDNIRVGDMVQDYIDNTKAIILDKEDIDENEWTVYTENGCVETWFESNFKKINKKVDLYKLFQT